MVYQLVPKCHEVDVIINILSPLYIIFHINFLLKKFTFGMVPPPLKSKNVRTKANFKGIMARVIIIEICNTNNMQERFLYFFSSPFLQ